MEGEIRSDLEPCTEEEKGSRLNLLKSLHAYRLTLCPDSEPAPQCSLDTASQCLVSLTAVMDTVTVEEDQICSSLGATLKCVKAYTSKCSASESEEVNQGVLQALSVYQSTCSELLTSLVLEVPDKDPVVVSACSVDSTVLDACDKTSVSMTCSSVAAALDCYKKEVGNCVGTSAASYRTRFTEAFPAQTALASLFCGLNLNTWTLDTGAYTAPACDAEAAVDCFKVSDITDASSALLQGPGRVTGAASCLVEKLSGCDVLVRAKTVLQIERKVDIFINLFPTLQSLDLKLTVTFSDPLGDLVPIVSEYLTQLHLAFTSSEWNLLPLCWWLHDLAESLETYVDGNSFLTSVFSRGVQGLKDSVSGVCNDPEIIGVILDLPDSESDDCPLDDILQRTTTGLMEAVFTGILQQDSRSQLCDLLEEAEDLDLDACSPGLGRQFMLMKGVAERVAGKVCDMPRYCSVRRVQHCLLDLVTTVQGLGAETSTREVCGSVTALDTCVRRFSYRCDDSSLMRIKTSVGPVRRMAVSVCGEITPPEPLPSCERKEEDGEPTCLVAMAQDCSVHQLLRLLSPLADHEAQCRSLTSTRGCYERVVESCKSKGSDFTLVSRLPEAGLTALTDRFECAEEEEEEEMEEEEEEAAQCSAGCRLDDAEECIATLTLSLQFWGRGDGDACSAVTTARKCLMEKTRDCSSSVFEDFQRHLKSALSLHSSLTAQCVDVYSCLADFAVYGRQILSKEDAPEPASSDSDSKSKSDSKDSDSKSKSESKDTKAKSEDKDTKAKSESKDTKAKSESKDTKAKSESKDTKAKSEDKDTKAKSEDKDTKAKSDSKDTKAKSEDKTASKDSKDTKSKSEDKTASKDSKDTKSKSEDKTASKDSKDTKSKSEDKTASKDSSDSKDTKSKSEEETSPGKVQDGNLFVLCQRVRKAWECAEKGLDRLPRMQRKLLSQVFRPLWSLLSDRCSNTVQLQCYKCSNVPWEESDDECTEETEICRHNEQSCSTQLRTEGDQVFVTRGCMKPAHCHAKDKKNNAVSCCYTDNCNVDNVFESDPALEASSDCFVEYAVDCAFTFAQNLVLRGAVQCSSSLDNLQCVARYSEGCAGAKGLYSAANQLMLTLAQTTCVTGALSEGCQSIAVPSMEAILTNAYSAESACSGLEAASTSVDLLEERGECTSLDLVALRESLSYAAIVTHTSCNPDDCQAPSVEPAPSQEEEEEEKECSYFDMSLCGREALGFFASLNADNKEDICSEAEKPARCTAKKMDGCSAVASLQQLVDSVQKKAEDSCQLDLSVLVKAGSDGGNTGSGGEEEEECRPTVLCDLDAAFACADQLAETQNETKLCSKLEQAAECRAENVRSCRSLQNALTATYFESTLGSAMETCKDSATVDMTRPSDVYANSASCLTDLMEQMQTAMMADDFVEPVCDAAAAFKDCPSDLPQLTLNFITGDMTSMLDVVASEETCNKTEEEEPEGGERKRRQTPPAGCSKEERSKAVLIVTMSNLFSSVPLNSRSALCMRLNSAVETLNKQLSNTCGAVSLSTKAREMLEGIRDHGSGKLETYCVPVLYEPAGCKPDLLPTCMASFTSVSSFSKTEPDTLCRAAESALECMNKFAKDCPADGQKTVSAVWEQVRATVGNTCPNLTLGLFCPDKFPSVRNDLACDFDGALECLPAADDLGGLQRVMPDYCSELKSELECTNRGLQGCLQSQIRNATVAVSAISALATETTYCSIERSVTDFSTACVAREPCSVTAALSCFKLNQDEDVTNCSVIGDVRTCVDTALASCSAGTEAVNLAYDLFYYRFGLSAPADCTAPFSGILADDDLSSTYSCTNSFLENLRTGLETTRTMTSVCGAFSTYVTCISDAAGGSATLVAILKPATDYIGKVRDLFCQTDGVDASSVSVSAMCDLRTASYCLAQEFSWTLNRQFLPKSDSQNFCKRWNQQATRSCVTQHSSQCDDAIRSLLDDVADMSTRLVLASGACDTVSTCFMEEAYYNINRFSVAVTNYTIDKDVTKLCVKKLKTEARVESLTATCRASQRAMVAASLSRVTDLVEEECQDVELPAPPICPDLPVEQQRCNIGAAFSCIIDFNTRLLSQGPSLIWRDWCTSLESTIRCAAFNTSSCDREDSSLVTIMNALDDLREQAGYRCPWLTPDLCSRNDPCPVQSAGCDVDLQINLLNNPLDDVCGFVKKANECVKTNTITCTRAQIKVAEKTIERRLDDLTIPELTCDGTEASPCLLRSRAATWQILTKASGEDRSEACTALTEAKQCLADRVTSTPSQQVQSAKDLADQLETSVRGWCTTEGTCGDALALLMNSVFDWAIQLAANSDFDKASFCSTRRAVLADIALVKELYASTCSLPELNSLNTLLSPVSGGYTALCDADTAADCTSALTAAQTCLTNFDATHACSSANTVLACIAPAVGLCDSAVSTPLITQFTTLTASLTDCDRPPIVALLTSNKNPLYLSEQGGTVGIKFRLEEAFTSYTTTDSPKQVRIRAQISNKEPPTCLSDDSAEVSQLSVIYDSGELCGVRLAGDDSTWSSEHTILLVANQDGRQDGMQQAVVSLYADIYDYVADSDSWLRTDESYKLAEYDVNIEDTDVSNAVCSSVGDPHTKTFDGTMFNNHEAGEFLLYRNSFIATAVTVDYQECAPRATCTCAVEVYAPKTRVRFDRCKRQGASGPPEEITVSMPEKDDQSVLSVFRHSNLQTYYVVLPTGTVVTVEKKGNYLSVWITASSLDYGKTEGLCGLFDGHAYNDLILPSGGRYFTKTGDVQYGVLSPSDFINQWKVSALDSVLSSQAQMTVSTSCGCLDSSPSADQCGSVANVVSCDLVLGEDITALLMAEASQTSPGGRRRRAVEQAIDYSLTEPQANPGWPTPSNWTEAAAREHCEEQLDRVLELRYCDKAVLTANGTYSYDDVITMCVENIRLSDGDAYLNSSRTQAVQMCRSMFLRNTTYLNTETVRPVVMEFLHHTCSNNCNGNGDCQLGVCHCYPGYVGGECSHHLSELPLPSNTAVLHGGLCNVSAASSCEDIFISGRDFVDSAYLSCHIQSVEVDSSGQRLSHGQTSKVPAMLLTATTAHCRLRRSAEAHQTVSVAVSNDGSHPGEAMLFTAHDPRCYSCRSPTHFCSHSAQGACEIQGRCYMAQETSSADDCLLCDPAVNTRDWSYRDAPECEVKRSAAVSDDFSPLHGAIIGGVVALVAITAIVAVLCIIKKRQGQKSVGRDQETGRRPTAYDNAGYASNQGSQNPAPTDVEPQQFFRHGSMHKRAITQMTGNIPSSTQAAIY